MRAWGQATDLALLSLQALGQGTHWIVAHDTELPPDTVRKVLHRLAHAPADRRRAHIAKWTMVEDGRRNYWRPVYAFGPGANKPRPPALGHTAAARRWAQRCQVLAGPLVGTPVRQREAISVVVAARRAGVLL